MSKSSREQKDALVRFESYMESLSDDIDPVLTINRLNDILSTPTKSTFASTLQELVSTGVLQQIVRIVSPSTGAGIAEYSSITEVPDEVHDISADINIHIHPENIKVVYKLGDDIKRKMKHKP